MVRGARLSFALVNPLAAAPVWRAKLARHLLKLDLPARINRFFISAPDRMIDAYAQAAEPLFIVTAEEGGRISGVAEVHPHRDRPKAAEIALSVDRERRRAGVGWMLFSRAVAECRRRGIEDVWIVYLQDNIAMRRIADRAGFARVTGDQPGAVTAHLIETASPERR